VKEWERESGVDSTIDFEEKAELRLNYNPSRYRKIKGAYSGWRASRHCEEHSGRRPKVGNAER